MHHHTRPDPPMAAQSFPTDPSGLPEAGRPALLQLADGDTLELRVGPVAKRLGDTTVRMLGYNGSLPGVRLKLVGGDSGGVEHQELVESIVLAPSERAVVDVLVDRPGRLELEHHTPDRVYRLARIEVGEDGAGRRRQLGSSRCCGGRRS